MSTPTAIIASSLIGAGSAAIQGNKARKVGREQQKAADRRQRAQQKAAKETERRSRFNQRVQNQVANQSLRQAQNVDLASKGVSPLSTSNALSGAILNEASKG